MVAGLSRCPRPSAKVSGCKMTGLASEGFSMADTDTELAVLEAATGQATPGFIEAVLQAVIRTGANASDIVYLGLLTPEAIARLLARLRAAEAALVAVPVSRHSVRRLDTTMPDLYIVCQGERYVRYGQELGHVHGWVRKARLSPTLHTAFCACGKMAATA